MRRIIAGQLLKIARELLFENEMEFSFSREGNDGELDLAYRDIQTYVGRIRSNEEMDSYCTRTDTPEMMKVRIGISGHDEGNAIEKAIVEKAGGLAKRMNLKVL